MIPAIETQHLRKVYGTRREASVVALRDLSLEVREGDVFGFVGPNGAGKTTSIKILAGLAWPTSGEARIFGAPAGSVEARSRLGYLPEVSSYHEFMTVRELLMVHAALSGMPSGERVTACTEALEAVGLGARAGSRIRQLSKGMQQRFGIAQAMVGRPSLLILDELTSGLDPLAQKEVKDIIVALKARGITIFFSSHKLTEVEHICDTIAILHRGRMLRCGALKDMLEPGDTVHVRWVGSGDVLAGLRGRGLDPFQEDEVSCVVVPPRDAGALVAEIHAAGGALVSVTPRRLSLEDAFFGIIQEAEGDHE